MSGSCSRGGSVLGGRVVNLMHPGYAWAIRRETYEAMGGLLDWLPMGSGDFFMAHAFIDNLAAALKTKVGTDAYKRKLLAWGQRVSKHVQRDIGYVDGTLHHFWHGKKRERFYVERDTALHAAGFNPDADLAYNLRARNEDSIDAD